MFRPFLTILLTSVSFAAAAAEPVGRGDPLRSVLLDTVRPAVEMDIGTEVQFVVDVLQVEGNWGFLTGSIQNPDGSAIDFRRTAYAEAQAEGAFDGPSVRALLYKLKKHWYVEAFSIGATDVVEAGWVEEFGVPCSVVNFC
jgi:hypothetical protein